MSRRRIWLAMVVLGVSSLWALTLQAQVGGIPSAYGSPPLSPWLNLYQKQGGPVDNYHMFVQPQLQLNDALQTQQYGVQRNAASVAALGERLQSQMQASNAPPEQTGAGAGFYNHRVYFNNFRGVGPGIYGSSSGATFGGTSSGLTSATPYGAPPGAQPGVGGATGGSSYAPSPASRGTGGLGH